MSDASKPPSPEEILRQQIADAEARKRLVPKKITPSKIGKNGDIEDDEQKDALPTAVVPLAAATVATPPEPAGQHQPPPPVVVPLAAASVALPTEQAGHNQPPLATPGDSVALPVAGASAPSEVTPGDPPPSPPAAVEPAPAQGRASRSLFATLLLVFLAMVAGAGIMWLLMRDAPDPVAAAPTVAATLPAATAAQTTGNVPTARSTPAPAASTTAAGTAVATGSTAQASPAPTSVTTSLAPGGAVTPSAETVAAAPTNLPAVTTTAEAVPEGTSTVAPSVALTPERAETPPTLSPIPPSTATTQPRPSATPRRTRVFGAIPERSIVQGQSHGGSTCIKGRVVDSSGRGVGAATGQINNSGGFSYAWTTNGDGLYKACGATAGEWRVVLFYVPGNLPLARQPGVTIAVKGAPPGQEQNEDYWGIVTFREQ